MKSDFLLAITQLSAEKNLSKEVVLGAVEAALASAYRKNSFAPNQEISVKINPSSGRVEVWAEKTVVEQVSDSRCEVSLKEAFKLNPDAQLEDAIYVEDTPHNAGRIAAQTAKQVILQRLHEAEHSAIYEEYTDKQGDIITGMVRRIESRQVFVDLGRSEAIMPSAEQAPNERYRVGQRLKVYLVEVSQTAKGPVLIVSRSHPNLLRRLFELEVPEIFNGTVEIKAIAREAGFRSKVAVAARQEGIDPVGCCVGLRGIRIQNIVNELNGEKIDVVSWSSDMSTFIMSAISPAQVARVELHEENAATVVIPDRQLSLAIGKEGQNVRLAVKLTGWRIDIKSASEYEQERAEAAKDEVPSDEELVVEAAGPSPVSAEVTPETIESSTEAKATLEAVAKPIRFAEELLTTAKAKPQTKDKKKKKKTVRKESTVDGIRLKKKRRVEISEDEDEETDYF
jgi:N utilization substance protein A